MKKYLLLFLVILFGFSHLQAQFTNVMIDNSFQPEEPSIALNILNTDEVAAGSNGRNNYYSTDGGATWTKNLLSSTYGATGDPCLVSDSLGNIFYFHLSNGYNKVVCQTSSNGGSSYNDGSSTSTNNPKFEDKEWASTDQGTNNLYITWTEYDNGYLSPGPTDSSRVYFAKSTDHGGSFTNGIRLNQIAGDCLYLDITDPHSCAGPNGEVYVTFMDSSGIRFNVSTDSGNTWLPSQPLIDSGGAYRYYSVPGVNRIRAMPYIACDRSDGPHRGNLYVSWTDTRNGLTNTDLFFVKSGDGGNTWSLPVNVSSDNTNHQYRNAMAVDQTNGYIYIAYYDRRNYVNNDSMDVYLAKSSDGGNTWTNYKISNSPFISSGSTFDGDYIDITAHAGIVRPVWTRVDNTTTSIWTALYNESTAGIASINSTTGLNFSVNPNPANIMAAISFSEEAQNVDGYITDVSGKEILSFHLNHEREKVIDLITLPSGVYFVKASNRVKKLIVQK